MTAVTEQVFPGAHHRVRFFFQPSREPASGLAVIFADAAAEPAFQFVAELAPVSMPLLFVLDDFGPYAGEAGYPGCWYLGEGRSLTMADDVAALVEHARGTLDLGPGAVTAVGYGSGGFAALHLACRHGWGRVIAGSPQTRLGAHFVGDLADVAAFVAGGSTSQDSRWADELLFKAIAAAPALPSIELLADARTMAAHVEPLREALRRRGTNAPATLLPAADAPGVSEQRFACYLIDQLAGTENGRTIVALSENADDHASPWSRVSGARVSRTADGVRCFAAAVGHHETGVYAGLRFQAAPLEMLRIDMTVRRPQDLESIYVDVNDGSDRRLARWRWLFERYWPPTSGRMSLLLTPDSGPPLTVSIGDLARAETLDLFVKIADGRSADFTVHSIELFGPTPIRPAGHLPLPRSSSAAAGVRMLRDVAHTVRHVSELAAEGIFPPAAAIPDVPPRRPNLKVACLLDPFSELGFKPEFDYVDFTPADARTVIEREAPQMLLVESIWRGKDASWQKLMVPDSLGSGPTDAVRDLVADCRRRGIPTVFWNKEDSPNFEHFIKTAELFDYIFTTDESCIPRYQEAVGHDRVAVLPFSAQPVLHNPAGAPVPRPLDVAFLGTFYGRKHAARKRQMEMILDPAREFDVHIYSRVEASGGYAFPEKYRPHVIGTVPYEQVLGAYRNYKVLLNVNSVPDSRTMCARRVFEILACGGMVVSGPSPALDATLGAGLVFDSDSYGHTKEVLGHLLGNDALRDRIAVEAIRRIHRAHTYSHRVDTILAAVGLASDVVRQRIAVVAPASSPETIDAVLAQTRRPEALVLVGPDQPAASALDRAHGAGIEVVHVPDVVTGEAALLGAAATAQSADLYALWMPGAVYGDPFLEDLENAHGYTRADILGKAAHYRIDPTRGWIVVERRTEENCAVESVEPATVLASRSALTRVPPARGEDAVAWQQRCREQGLSIYATDRFNFVASPGTGGMTLFAPSTVEAFGPGAQHVIA